MRRGRWKVVEHPLNTPRVHENEFGSSASYRVLCARACAGCTLHVACTWKGSLRYPPTRDDLCTLEKNVVLLHVRLPTSVRKIVPAGASAMYSTGSWIIRVLPATAQAESPDTRQKLAIASKQRRQRQGRPSASVHEWIDGGNCCVYVYCIYR